MDICLNKMIEFWVCVKFSLIIVVLEKKKLFFFEINYEKLKFGCEKL